MIKQLGEKLGKDAIISADSSAADEYRTTYGKAILGIALPANTDELRSIVLTAGELKAAIRILGFGNSAGVTRDGDLLVDLRRMNKIVEVNKHAAYALVEPGVTYRQLYNYLQDNKTGLWIDCDRNELNSVAASIAAHEFGYTPHGDHMMMQCGMEVMLANGVLTRVGMGALPGSNTWQLAKYAYGPYVDGLFTQSNLGIVTKIGVWLMPAPPAYKPFMLSLQKRDDISQAVDILRPLKINVIVPNSVVISNALLDAAPFSKRKDYLLDGKVDLDKIKKAYELGEWNLYGALYNTPDNVDVLWPMVSGALNSIEGSKLYTDDARKGDPIWTKREELMRGIPADGFDQLNQWQGKYRCDIGIACPLNGDDILQLNVIVADTLQKYEMEDLSECVVGWRSLIKRNYFLFDQETKDNAENCINKLISNAAAEGFGLTHSRTSHPEFAIQYARSPGLSILQKRLKTALDPDAVIA